MLAAERGAAREHAGWPTAADLLDFAAYAATKGEASPTASAARWCSLYRRGSPRRRLSPGRRRDGFRPAAVPPVSAPRGRPRRRPDRHSWMRRGCPAPCRNISPRPRSRRCSPPPAAPPSAGRAGRSRRWRSSMQRACASRRCWRCRPRALAAMRAVLLVRGKGGRERVVPLSRAAREAAAALLAASGKSGRWLFPGRDPRHALTRQGFGLLLKQVALAAGLDPARVSPHVLRHSFASPYAGARGGSAQPADRCSGTPTSPPRRSTRTCWPNACSGWSRPITRSPSPPGDRRRDRPRSAVLRRAACRISWISKNPSPSSRARSKSCAACPSPTAINISR